jgi:MarR family protein
MNIIVFMGGVADRIEELEWAAGALHDAAARLRRLAEAEELRALAAEGGPEANAAQVRALVAARRLWGDATGLGHGGDPAWAILMELLARRLEGRRIAIGALAEAADLAPTTSLRCLARLRAAGLIARRPHPQDERTVIVDLTDEAEDRLRAWLAGARRISPWIA